MGRKASKFPREPETTGIRALTHDGRGIVDADGKTVFVDGALPGETVCWERVRRKRNYDEARALDVITPSDQRAEPICEVFGQCGGCVMQHLNLDAQVIEKQKVLYDCFERTGGVNPTRWLPPLAGNGAHYRRRARLGVRYVDGKQRVLIGFRERYKPYITDMQRCPVLVEPVSDLIEPLIALVSQLSIVRRLPQIEVSVGDLPDGKLVSMILRVLDPPSDADAALLSAFCDEHDVWFWLQHGGPDDLEPVPRAAGEPPALYYRLPAYDLNMNFAANDFIQVNAEINERMIEQAIALLDVRATDRVLDLYSGIGNFTLPIARTAAHVHGVEGSAALTQRALANAASNGIDNVSFATVDLSDESGWAPLLAQSWDLVLLDPARAGAEVFAALAARIGARRIVYVSCNPGTLARDAGELVASQGYTLEAAGVMNMFPHTAHVESIACFDRLAVQD
ncbi:MAG: 23S rRNA (uracil(1939)-C(5))-methyltransferase RlmD [Pseudomonadota bacterium]